MHSRDANIPGTCEPWWRRAKNNWAAPTLLNDPVFTRLVHFRVHYTTGTNDVVPVVKWTWKCTPFLRGIFLQARKRGFLLTCEYIYFPVHFTFDTTSSVSNVNWTRKCVSFLSSVIRLLRNMDHKSLDDDWRIKSRRNFVQFFRPLSVVQFLRILPTFSQCAVG